MTEPRILYYYGKASSVKVIVAIELAHCKKKRVTLTQLWLPELH